MKSKALDKAYQAQTEKLARDAAHQLQAAARRLMPKKRALEPRDIHEALGLLWAAEARLKGMPWGSV